MNVRDSPSSRRMTFGVLDVGSPRQPPPEAGRHLRAGIVGVGVIGAVHLDVLRAFPEVTVDFVVDPRPVTDARRQGVPQAETLLTALESAPAPDLVVVATPTDSHLELVGEALKHTQALVVSEKPLTRDLAQLRSFEHQHADGMARIRVVNHFAFSPEIEWAVRLITAEGWGTPRRVLSNFNDPYILKTAEQLASYVSPWVDSGANQVSMLSRICHGWVIRGQQVDASGLRVVTELDFVGGEATLVANWWTGDSSKQTTLHWPTGAEIHLDHTAMTGFAVVDGTVVHHVGHDGAMTRKAAHYTAMYRALLDGLDRDLLGVELARSVAGVLEAGAVAAARTTSGS